MDIWFHPTPYSACDYLSMLRLKLNHVSKRGYRTFAITLWKKLFWPFHCEHQLIGVPVIHSRLRIHIIIRIHIVVRWHLPTHTYIYGSQVISDVGNYTIINANVRYILPGAQDEAIFGSHMQACSWRGAQFNVRGHPEGSQYCLVITYWRNTVRPIITRSCLTTHSNVFIIYHFPTNAQRNVPKNRPSRRGMECFVNQKKMIDILHLSLSHFF